MGGSSSSSQTIGYRYFLSMHMGLCRGPVDELVQIDVGDLRAWPIPDGGKTSILDPGPEIEGLALVAHGPNGTGVALFENGTTQVVTADKINTIQGPLNGTTAINAPKLFGGDKKEGGVQGTLSFFMGAASQIIPTYIKQLLGGLVPDFRGVFTLFFDGLVCSLNPYPKAWKVRVRRTENGWDGPVWHQELATIWMANGSIKAMNPAHIVYECLTNRDWGRGFPRSVMHENQMYAVAQKLYNENFGLCLKWNRQDELGLFIKDIIDHIGGSLYLDRTTGLMTMSLLRGDYDVNSIPTFTYDTGLLELIDDETASRDDLVNEVIIDWRDPIKNKKRQSRLHNLASLQSLGATKSTTTPYDGIPTADLAARVGMRDLKANSTSLKRFKVVLDRRAWRLIPGAVFKVSAPDMNVFSIVLRAGKIRNGVNTDGKITVEAVVDVFGLAASSYIDEQPSEWSPPDRSAVVPGKRLVREATYADLAGRLTPTELAAVDPLSGTIATMAAKPSTSSQNYSLATKVAAESFVIRESGSFAPAATVSALIGLYSTSVSFTGGQDLGLVELGTPIQIGDEICRLDNISSVDGISGILTVARGCTDTLPGVHAIGTPIFFFDGDLGSDEREYVLGEAVDVKLLTNTSTQQLSIAAAATDTVTIVGRQGKPWAPGNMRVNGVPYGSAGTVTGTINLTWAHRDRKITQDILLEHGAASVGPEPGVTYTVRVYNGEAATVPVRTALNVTGTTWSYTNAQRLQDGVGAVAVFEVEAVRSGVKSMFKYRFGVSTSDSGYGYDYGQRYGG